MRRNKILGAFWCLIITTVLNTVQASQETSIDDGSSDGEFAISATAPGFLGGLGSLKFDHDSGHADFEDTANLTAEEALRYIVRALAPRNVSVLKPVPGEYVSDNSDTSSEDSITISATAPRFLRALKVEKFNRGRRLTWLNYISPLTPLMMPPSLAPDEVLRHIFNVFLMPLYSIIRTPYDKFIGGKPNRHFNLETGQYTWLGNISNAAPFDPQAFRAALAFSEEHKQEYIVETLSLHSEMKAAYTALSKAAESEDALPKNQQQSYALNVSQYDALTAYQLYAYLLALEYLNLETSVQWPLHKAIYTKAKQLAAAARDSELGMYEKLKKIISINSFPWDKMSLKDALTKDESYSFQCLLEKSCTRAVTGKHRKLSPDDLQNAALDAIHEALNIKSARLSFEQVSALFGEFKQQQKELKPYLVFWRFTLAKHILGITTPYFKEWEASKQGQAVAQKKQMHLQRKADIAATDETREARLREVRESVRQEFEANAKSAQKQEALPPESTSLMEVFEKARQQHIQRKFFLDAAREALDKRTATVDEQVALAHKMREEVSAKEDELWGRRAHIKKWEADFKERTEEAEQKLKKRTKKLEQSESHYDYQRVLLNTGINKLGKDELAAVRRNNKLDDRAGKLAATEKQLADRLADCTKREAELATRESLLIELSDYKKQEIERAAKEE